MLLCVIKTLNEAPAVIIATISLAGAGSHRAFMKTNGLAINKLVERRKTKQNCYKDLWSLSKSRVVLYTRPNRSHHNVHVQLHAQMHIHMPVRQWYYAIAACPSISGDFFP